MDLTGYEVTFRRDPLMGWWSYTVETPDGQTLRPLLGSFMDKRNAERNALRRIELHKAKETVSADELLRRITA